MKRRDTDDLLAIMARLRAPDGCPWDRKQTPASILSNLIEEAYEFVDAVEGGDPAEMKEELGDILLQVVFQAQMAKEGGAFDYADVVVIGDTPSDVACANAVGAVPVAVATGTYSVEVLRSTGAPFVLEDLSDTEGFMRMIEG